jgi:hypothetical protein
MKVPVRGVEFCEQIVRIIGKFGIILDNISGSTTDGAPSVAGKKQYGLSALIVEEMKQVAIRAPDNASYTRVYPKVSGLAAWSENCK